jgi:hypothetical protein
MPDAQQLRPTIVSRIALGLVAGPIAAVGVYSGSWVLAGGTAGVFAAASAAIGRRRVTVDETGVRARGAVGERGLAWDAIDHYTYWSGTARTLQVIDPRIDAPANSVLGSRHVLDLHGRDGKRIRIDSRYHGAERAIAAIVREVHARHAGRTSFSPFEVRSDGLHHARAGLLPWNRLELVKLDAQQPPRLRVLEHGKAWPWANEPMSRIHDGLLLLEQLAERGVRIERGIQQLVTAKLAERMAAQAALPRAEVVRPDRSS